MEIGQPNTPPLTPDNMPAQRRISRGRWIIYSIPVILILVAVALPNFVRARTTSCKNACVNNLRQIDGAKEQWALEKEVQPGAEVSETEVGAYIKGGWPSCPGGGVYTAGPIAQPPTCSMGHTL